MDVFVVTKQSLCPIDFLQRIKQISRTGARGIILREKELAEEAYMHLARQCQKRLQTTECSLFLNQHFEIARALQIPNIQVSYPVFAANRELLRKSFTQILVSVHQLEEAMQAAEWGVDGLIAGHIFPTACKLGVPPRGLDFLQEICQSVSIPVYAIGGIQKQTYAQIASTRAAGICVMSAAMKGDFFWNTDSIAKKKMC